MNKEQDRVWTVRELMKSAISFLQKRGFEEARLNVELLLSHALRCQRIELYTSFAKSLAQEEVDEFRELYDRRLKHEPLQYIIGSTNFMGLRIKVDSRVLIPRPETETLVEQAMIVCSNLQDERSVDILDLGTGSGNIAIALAKFVRNATVTGVENSNAALEVAKMNVGIHGVRDRVVLKEMDIFEPLDQLLLKRFDVVVSNPPYIPPDEWENLSLEIKEYEPRNATADSKDGFEFYRRIIELAPFLTVDEGNVLVEVGDGQASGVAALMDDVGFYEISTACDLQGRDRVVSAKCRSKSRNPTVSN